MVQADAAGLVSADCVACVVQSEHVSKLVRIPGIVTAASKPKVGQRPPSLHTAWLALVLRSLTSRVTRYNLSKMHRLPCANHSPLSLSGQGRAGQGTLLPIQPEGKRRSSAISYRAGSDTETYSAHAAQGDAHDDHLLQVQEYQDHYLQARPGRRAVPALL